MLKVLIVNDNDGHVPGDDKEIVDNNEGRCEDAKGSDGGERGEGGDEEGGSRRRGRREHGRGGTAERVVHPRLEAREILGVHVKRSLSVGINKDENVVGADTE